MKIRYGVRVHDISNGTFEEKIKFASEKGIKTVQLVLKKAFSDININEGCLTPGFAKYINEILNKYNIEVSILGYYFNMTNPDKIQLRKDIELFKAHLKFAKYLGCSAVATETGSIDVNYQYNKKNSSDEAYQEFLRCFKEIVSEAEQLGVIIAIEGVWKHIIYSPEMMKKALDDINSNNVSVILDLVNYLNKNNYMDEELILQKCINLFGSRINYIHLKDYLVNGNEINIVNIGEGICNLNRVMKYLKENKPYIDVILEESNDNYIYKAIKYLGW